MHAAPLIVNLCLIAIVGCAAPVSLARTSAVSKPVFRAESNGLGDLESAAHAKRKGEVEKKRSERKNSPSCCSRCNNCPCSCGNSLRSPVVANLGSTQNSCNSSDESNFTGQLFLIVLSAPFSLPAMAIGDDFDHFTEFPDYPYADDVPGSLLIGREFKSKTQSFTANLQTFAIPGSSDLDRFGGRLVVENGDRIGIDTETDYWLQTHRKSGPEHAWNGDFNFVFRFAETEQIQMRAGIGVNWLADQIRPEYGINFTYGIEWFPRRPWTVSSVIDWGTLGASALFHNRSTVGVMVGATDLFAGYDYFQLGTAHFHGPVAGVGYRF